MENSWKIHMENPISPMSGWLGVSRLKPPMESDDLDWSHGSPSDLWFRRPTQLFTHGQWWSMSKMHALGFHMKRENEGSSSKDVPIWSINIDLNLQIQVLPCARLEVLEGLEGILLHNPRLQVLQWCARLGLKVSHWTHLSCSINWSVKRKDFEQQKWGYQKKGHHLKRVYLLIPFKGVWGWEIHSISLGANH